VRVQGVSPFLFTFRLVAFNLASYPALADAAWRACLDLLQRGWPFHPCWRNLLLAESLSSRHTVRFCSRADPPGPLALTRPLASRRGDFPQCRTLSATLLLPRGCPIALWTSIVRSGTVLLRNYSIRATPLVPWTPMRRRGSQGSRLADG